MVRVEDFVGQQEGDRREGGAVLFGDLDDELVVSGYVLGDGVEAPAKPLKISLV
jgi:hypothetical protein